MGFTHVRAKVYNPSDVTRHAELDLLVDTGAIYTIVPREVLEGLGLRPEARAQKLKLLERLRRRLEGVSAVVFAYLHGSFVDRDSFRGLDVAIWIRGPGESFYYTVDFSAKLVVEMGVPVDVQVLNEAPLPLNTTSSRGVAALLRG